MSYENEPSGKRSTDPLLDPPPGISLSAFFEQFFAESDARAARRGIDPDGAEDEAPRSKR